MPTETKSTFPLGTPAPEFALPDVVTGQVVTLSELPPAKALLVAFVCRHCPYVVHVRDTMITLARELQPKGAAFVAISSNDAIAYPDDAPDKLKEMAIEYGFPFPLLFDETQDIARAYDAQCTPDFFLFDADRKLAFHGRIDESTPGTGVSTGLILREAIEALLAGQPVSAVQKACIGCSIKWKKA